MYFSKLHHYSDGDKVSNPGICLCFEFPKKRGVRQVFDCKWFISEVISEASVGDVGVGNEAGKGRQSRRGCSHDRFLFILLGLFGRWCKIHPRVVIQLETGLIHQLPFVEGCLWGAKSLALRALPVGGWRPFQGQRMLSAESQVITATSCWWKCLGQGVMWGKDGVCCFNANTQFWTKGMVGDVVYSSVLVLLMTT